MVTLAVESSGGNDLTYQLAKDTISIGASSRNDVVIRAPGVAPEHVVIQRSGDVFTFLTSRRQTVALNGERRSRGVLHVGDKLRIGTAVVIFRGLGADDVEIVERHEGCPEGVQDAGGAPDRDIPAEAAPGPAKAELLLRSEAHGLAEVRRQMVEAFREGLRADLLPSLKVFFEISFPGRQAMLAWAGENGRFEPIVSLWTTDIPRLPQRVFNELAAGGRFATLHIGNRETLIYPVDQGELKTNAFVVLESSPETSHDDELLLAELTRFLAVSWERVERSSSLYGAWEKSASRSIDERLVGSSNAVAVLRQGVLKAARGMEPVLITGPVQSGRSTVASLIAALHPTGELPVQVFQGRPGDAASLRKELFGDAGEGIEGLVSRAKGGVLLVRDVQLLSVELQREISAHVREDLQRAYGPSVRWMATTGNDVLALVQDGALDGELFAAFQSHLLRVPSLAERREDLPLIIVSLLHRLAQEQGKEIRGIELETLNSLVSHGYDGEMGELVAELRRLVSATPDGEMVQGIVPLDPSRYPKPAGGQDGQVPSVNLLEHDDLKIVIAGVERMIIDRVMRRTMGNQSRAARELNLSRGALIAKIKEYEIPDYRYLRRQKK
ncbi:MAG: hypothetical protein GXP47_06500 [Acidobacteria bacterium]|nr:hypothetical protein [Acidobacteriota bacterium]